MPSAELTIELPSEEVDFLQAYAKAHGTTVAELMARYSQALRGAPPRPIHPDVQKITGIIPPEVDAKEAYTQHILEKHR